MKLNNAVNSHYLDVRWITHIKVSLSEESLSHWSWPLLIVRSCQMMFMRVEIFWHLRELININK